ITASPKVRDYVDWHQQLKASFPKVAARPPRATGAAIAPPVPADAINTLRVSRPKEIVSTKSTPSEIAKSLERFRRDHPETTKTAFIMMRFGNTPGHRKIATAIRETLEPLGVTALRADEKDYHSDLYWNVLTYVYGCTFGVAAFERFLTDEFNPNVSLEV